MDFYKNITDFIFVEDEPVPADIIFVPGGAYGEIAVHAARLFKAGYAGLVLPSGKYSILKERFEGPVTPDKYRGTNFETECEFLSQILADEGVPDECILKEKEASYTYENAIYSRKLLDAAGLEVRAAILSCQAYHARRCLMYYQLMFPAARFAVCPTETRGINRNSWYREEEKIDMVLNEVERCGRQFHKILKDRC